ANTFTTNPGVTLFSDFTLAEVLLATVSGSATICPGGSTMIQAALTGTPPWNVTWSDSFTQMGVMASPATRTVSPSSTTIYTVTAVSDMVGPGASTGSATVTVDPIAPTVTAPMAALVTQTLCQ
ncbi:MAG TPA: hypothetical protein VGR00_03270, partial [Thermoanaerobaculia bacterium]|nr:hypothetical protein [Thermoanaerobaculia bacterium]